MELYCDDCFNVLKEIQDKSINCIITDPPYQISRESGFKSGKLQKYKTISIDFGEWDHEQLDIHSLLTEYYRVLVGGGSVIMFYDIFKLESLCNIAKVVGFKQLRVCYWEKTNPVPVNARTNYLSNARECFVTMVKGSNPTFHSYYDNGVYRYPICSGKERTKHPTQKPLDLIAEIVKKHTNENDLVLDTFMGSGTTGVACTILGRDFIGIEKDENYFDVAKKRIEEEIEKNRLWHII